MDEKGIDVREGLKYSEQHEWIKEEGDDLVTCGITDFAQNSLGDIVFVEFTVTDGDVKVEEAVAVVESAKAASDVYTPLSGEITEVNSIVEDSPETLNKDPYGKGWLFKIKLSGKEELEKLMTPEQYKAFIAAGG